MSACLSGCLYFLIVIDNFDNGDLSSTSLSALNLYVTLDFEGASTLHLPRKSNLVGWAVKSDR